MSNRVRAVAVVFALNGLVFASLVSRVPAVRSGLDVDNGTLGLLLLCIAVGSLALLPTSGALVSRFGSTAVVRAGALAAAVGVVVAGVGATVQHSLVLTAVGLVLDGAGVAAWDVAMNVEGAEAEREVGRSVMPRFHAAFSLGTVAGALLGAGAVAVHLPATAHLTVAGVVSLALAGLATAPFAVGGGDAHGTDDEQGSGAGSLAAWREPRTILVGLVVLAFAVSEGSANDWLALALVDGRDVSPAVGVAGFALFVAAMTVGRVAGTNLVDRLGRAATLRVTGLLAVVGLVLTVAGPPWLAVAGIVLWGVGTSLGFPLGMSAAADDARRAPARVAVVSTIGYGAFLAGPPLLGHLGDHVGTLPALLAVVVLLVPAVVAARVTEPTDRAAVA